MIQNIRAWAAALVVTIKLFWDQFRWKLILKLIKGIWRVLQKLLRYFNGTIISTFSLPLPPDWPAIFSSNLNELVSALTSSKPVISPLSAKACSSLQYCYKIQYVFE